MRSDAHLLRVLQDHYARRRGMPSFAELARAAGIGVSTVAGIVGRLKTEGFLQATETGRLLPGKRFFERHVLNRVQAGLPAEAADVLPEAMLIDAHLIEIPSRTILLRVRGASMRDAGLLPDDTVVVLRGAVACPGDIVVALVDGEYTVKRLDIDDSGQPVLRAANPEFEDVRPAEELEVVGVVVGQFRRYARQRLRKSATDSTQKAHAQVQLLTRKKKVGHGPAEGHARAHQLCSTSTGTWQAEDGAITP